MAKFCKRCGKPLDPNGRCPGCGYQDVSAQVENPTIKATERHTPEKPVSDYSSGVFRKQKSKALMWIVVAILVVLLVVIYFVFIKTHNLPVDDPEETKQSSSGKTVPDKTIEWVIEDYLKANKNFAGTYTDCESDVSHELDKSTKTDSVRIDLIIKYPSLTASSSYEATYQYDKTKDVWEVIRGGDWTPLQVDRYEISSLPADWMNALRTAGYDAIVKWQGQEEAERFINGYIPPDNQALRRLLGAANDGWKIECEREYISVYYAELDTNENARILFDGISEGEGIERYYTITKMEEGNRYSYLTVEEGTDLYCVLIRSENMIFLVYASSGANIPYRVEEGPPPVYPVDADKIDTVLREVGFFPVR